MSSFFGEVKPALQLDFAHQYGITDAQVKAAAKSFAQPIRMSPIRLRREHPTG
jgi:hypothetical protein